MIDRRTSGILLHVTSLPSRFGIGDLGPEAYRFARFLEAGGQGIWQILPLGPTEPAFGNSPYASTSAFAGNPLLISPELLIKDGYLKAADLESVPPFSADRVSYIKAAAYKEALFARALSHVRPGSRDAFNFERFCSGHAAWLDDHASFMVLRKHFEGRAWNQWPAGLRDRNRKELSRWRKEHDREIVREKFLQFLFFKQWAALRHACNRKGIQIVGDLPIYVHYDSSDVWAHPGLFQLDSREKPTVVAGVPPDYFSTTGQKWGNPIYRWNVMKKSGFEWWIERIEHSLKFYDILRLDHFRGFAGYWEVPAHHKTARRGRWVPGPGAGFFAAVQRRIPMMPFIAEDLGEITPDVYELRDRFGLPGMRILQFAFENDDMADPYKPHNYIANCVAYTGTHDNNTLVGWIHGQGATSRQRSIIRRSRENAFRYLGIRETVKEIHWRFIRALMMSAANQVILPLQDVLGLDNRSRMNRPSTANGNWEWRVRARQLTPKIEKELHEMTSLYGRR